MFPKVPGIIGFRRFPVLLGSYDLNSSTVHLHCIQCSPSAPKDSRPLFSLEALANNCLFYQLYVEEVVERESRRMRSPPPPEDPSLALCGEMEVGECC